MDETILYGLGEHARNRYAGATPGGGVFHGGERTPFSVASPASSSVQGDGSGERVLTVHELAFIRRMESMSMARESLFRVLNRTWLYDESIDSLYGILQKQREREAARAIGLAYAHAAAVAEGMETSVSVGAATEDRRAELSAASRVKIPNGGKSVTEWYAAIKRTEEQRKNDRKEKNV